jgi:hypothetical protein
MITYTLQKLESVIEKHRKWLENNSKGERANLRSANLSFANLSSADLSFANLSSADLRSVNLRSANLSSANLSFANLSSANLDKKYIHISCIGSTKRQTTYCFEDNKIWCGCFIGTLQEFKVQVNKKHKNNPLYLCEYLSFIQLLENIKLLS